VSQGLRLITAWSSETLADWLADWYSVASADPFARELVVVPTPGMERYLTRRLARRLGVSDPAAEDGVCAALDFMQPQDLMATVLAGAGNDDDPWLPAALQWHCLRAVDDLVNGDDDAFVGLRHHLRDGTREARRIAVAREAAQLLDNYATQRPELLLAWQAGDDSQTPAEHVWQAAVFRHVLAQVGIAPWPLRVRDVLATGVGDVDLPRRLAVVGVTRYGALDLQLLEALARDREVAVVMVEHSPGHAANRHEHMDQNQLVATLADEELFAVRSLEAMTPQRERLTGYPEAGATLLTRVQAGIVRDEPVRKVTSVGDDSLTVHGCCGALRQVEVLRDQVLRLLVKDDTLQARDVLIMCTDLDVFAPLIAQVFGTTTSPIQGPTRDLRVSVADRVARIDNPVLQVVQTLVDLLAARMTTAEVMDLIELPAVAQRFGLDSADHGRIERLATEAGIRWGLSSEHRHAFSVAAGPRNTWQYGLDRLAAGLVVDGRGFALMRGVAPIKLAADSDVHLVAVLDQVVSVLQQAWEFARSPHPARQWAAAIADWIEPLVGGEQWHLAAALAVVTQALDGDEQIGLGEAAVLLDAELARFGPRPRLLAGGVDVVAMRPMRNIPFRVVCLLGMDDGAFPRAVALGGNDLLALDPRPGERDPRAEDRQLFLDAICAAQQHLVITYSSRNPATGGSLPPAAPLAELLDAVGDVVHHHPLVAHDPRNFTTDSRGAVASSFDRTAAALASAEREAPQPVRAVELAMVDEDVSVDDLLAFWKSPAKAFLRRLGLPIERDQEPDDLELPIDLTGLAEWAIGNALLTTGDELDTAQQVAAARGRLPVVGSDAAWKRVATKVANLRAAALSTAPSEVASVEYAHLELPLDAQTGTVLTGVLPHPAVGPIVDVTYSRGKAAGVLDLRIRIAALSAAGVPTEGVLISPGSRGATMHRERPWDQGVAAKWLRLLAYLRRVGLARPLPFSAKTSYAYARELPDGDKANERARKEWSGPFGGRGEQDAPESRMLWDSDWSVLTEVAPMSGNWLPAQPSLFAQLAAFVFGEPS